MVEPHWTQPGLEPGVRLPAARLREGSWAAQLIPLRMPGPGEARMLNAVRRTGHDRLLGAVVDPRYPKPGMVWSVPSDPDGFRIFIGAHTGRDTLLWTPDHSQALLGDGEELLAVAGPPAFVLDAVGGDAAATARAWEKFRTNIAATHERPEGYQRIMAHYAPFALSGGAAASS